MGDKCESVGCGINGVCRDSDNVCSRFVCVNDICVPDGDVSIETEER